MMKPDPIQFALYDRLAAIECASARDPRMDELDRLVAAEPRLPGRPKGRRDSKPRRKTAARAEGYYKRWETIRARQAAEVA